MSCQIKYNQISIENDIGIMSSTRAIIFDNIDERFLAHVFFGYEKLIFCVAMYQIRKIRLPLSSA